MRIARGLQNKVLEAMAVERAVVLTPEAAEGIAAVHNRDFAVASGTSEMIDAFFHLLGDKTERQQIGEAARRLVTNDYNWAGEMDRFALLATGCSKPASIPGATIGAGTFNRAVKILPDTFTLSEDG